MTGWRGGGDEEVVVLVVVVVLIVKNRRREGSRSEWCDERERALHEKRERETEGGRREGVVIGCLGTAGGVTRRRGLVSKPIGKHIYIYQALVGTSSYTS